MINDLLECEINSVFDRAASLAGGAAPLDLGRRTAGLVFLDASLRTRVGFAAAAGRLGMVPLEVLDQRASASSMPESIAHTLRTVAGYSDVLIARVPVGIADVVPSNGVPVINGGDAGATPEHPTQALVDVFAIEHQTNRPVTDCRIAICGDLRMRAVRSLLALLSRRIPRDLLLITDSALESGFHVPENLRAIARHGDLSNAREVDVLYAAGIPHLALSESGRSQLRVTGDVLRGMRPDAVLLSPLPVIDEVDREALADPRCRVFVQSDDALHVRTAILEHILGHS